MKRIHLVHKGEDLKSFSNPNYLLQINFWYFSFSRFKPISYLSAVSGISSRKRWQAGVSHFDLPGDGCGPKGEIGGAHGVHCRQPVALFTWQPKCPLHPLTYIYLSKWVLRVLWLFLFSDFSIIWWKWCIPNYNSKKIVQNSHITHFKIVDMFANVTY